MELRFAFVADAATSSDGHKINALGILATIAVPQIPCVLATISLVASFDLKPADYGATRDIYLRLITADGDSLRDQRITANLPNRDPSATGKKIICNIVLNVPAIKFEKPGDYEFVIEINTRHMVTIPFEVILAQAPKPPM